MILVYTKFGMVSFAASFSSYSHNNQILILAQNPAATMVKTFVGWKQLGRKVSGSGIMIYTPAPRKRKKMVEQKDDNGKPVLDAKGNPVRDEISQSWMDYSIAYVFDVSQTSGASLPELRGMDEDPLYTQHSA